MEQRSAAGAVEQVLGARVTGGRGRAVMRGTFASGGPVFFGDQGILATSAEQAAGALVMVMVVVWLGSVVKHGRAVWCFMDRRRAAQVCCTTAC